MKPLSYQLNNISIRATIIAFNSNQLSLIQINISLPNSYPYKILKHLYIRSLSINNYLNQLVSDIVR